MKNILPILSLFFISAFLLGCTSYPDQMVIEKVSVKITDHAGYLRLNDNEQIMAESIEIKFQGFAPFAYMHVNDFMEQTRCYIYKTDKKAINHNAFASVYFDKRISPKDLKTSYYAGFGDEKYQYVAYAFPGLTWSHNINGSDDINLLEYDFNHIECGLWGVKMFGPFVRSNVISITKDEFLALHKEFMKDVDDNEYKRNAHNNFLKTPNTYTARAFFNSMPSKFSEFNEIYGYPGEPGPLYELNMYESLPLLKKYIPLSQLADKYVALASEGAWDADNVNYLHNAYRELLVKEPKYVVTGIMTLPRQKRKNAMALLFNIFHPSNDILDESEKKDVCAISMQFCEELSLVERELLAEEEHH